MRGECSSHRHRRRRTGGRRALDGSASRQRQNPQHGRRTGHVADRKLLQLLVPSSPLLPQFHRGRCLHNVAAAASREVHRAPKRKGHSQLRPRRPQKLLTLTRWLAETGAYKRYNVSIKNNSSPVNDEQKPAVTMTLTAVGRHRRQRCVGGMQSPACVSAFAGVQQPKQQHCCCLGQRCSQLPPQPSARPFVAKRGQSREPQLPWSLCAAV